MFALWDQVNLIYFCPDHIAKMLREINIKANHLSAPVFWLVMSALLVCLPQSRAQDTLKRQGVFSQLYTEMQVHGAFLIPHHPEMWALTGGYFPMTEFSLIRQTDGRQACNAFRNYPQMGITYRFTDFGGSQSLGSLHAVMPFVSFPLIKHERTALSFRIAIGMAWVRRIFDRYENYRNLAIGSHLNAAVGFQLSLRRMINNRVYLTATAAMTHVSNGTIRTPNFGLNMPSLSAGLGFKLNNKKINYHPPDPAGSLKGHRHLSLQLGMAVKQIKRNWDDEFRVYVVSMSYDRYYNKTNLLRISLDAMYDESVKYLLRQQEKNTGRLTDVTKYGLSLGHAWTFSRLSLFVGLGYYLHNPLGRDELFYDKLGVNYRIFNFLYAGVTLQAHWAQADFFSAGLGFKL